MSGSPARHEVLAALGRGTERVVGALRDLGVDELQAPSRLPGWTRLTIACHLRYGADALREMTARTLSGELAAYYPGGRDELRPTTLLPAPGEMPRAVVESLARLSDRLQTTWAALEPADWDKRIHEPADNPDVGPLRLDELLLSRLTEVEVHGSDLDWSDVFVTSVLPFRVARLAARRPDPSHRMSWRLTAEGGPSFLVSVDAGVVRVEGVGPSAPADGVIERPARHLVALLLGRHTGRSLTPVERSFAEAFPGP